MFLGSAVHRGCEIFFKNDARNLNRAILSAENFINSKREFSDAEQKSARENCEKVLREFFAENEFPKTAAVEWNLRANLKNFQMCGKVDRVEFTNFATKTAQIIDFKNQTPQSKNLISGISPKKDDKNPGRGIRQLLFSAVLAKNISDFPFRVENFAVQFLKKNPSGKFVKHEFAFSNAEILNFENEILKTCEKIRAGEFQKLQNDDAEKYCEKCPFFEVCFRGEN